MPSAGRIASGVDPAAARFGAAMYVPTADDDDIPQLRRQQGDALRVQGDLERKNSWMAAAALAPAAALVGLEGAGALAARLAPELEGGPLQFVENDPYLRVGDNWATRAGRLAHNALKERLRLKPGWDYEPDVRQLGETRLKPDVGAPARNPEDPDDRFQMELKPNTVSGRRAAARAVKRYKVGTGNKTRAIFYDPGDYM